MSSFSKFEYELYALLVLSKVFPDIIPIEGTIKGESPDWQNDRFGFGMEIVRAESESLGDAKAFANKYLGSPVSAIPEKRVNRLREKLSIIKDGTLKAVEMYSFFGCMDNPDSESDSPFAKPFVDICEHKLKLLNSVFKQFERNILCVYFPISVDTDIAHIIYRCYINRVAQYSAIFSDLFFIGLSSLVHIDYKKNLIRNCDSYSDELRESLDRMVHVISALPVCKDGMELYGELLKRGVNLKSQNWQLELLATAKE